MNKEIMRAMGFGNLVDQVELGNCPFCKKKIDVESFKDKLSVKEWKISGLCQDCMDKIFDGGEDG